MCLNGYRMTIKAYRHLLLVWASFILSGTAVAAAHNGETLQITTHFDSIMGSPTWLLILRDVNSGAVFPYIFDIKNNNNYWVAFTTGHSYRVMASTLTFGPYAKIKNLCNIENGILKGKSLGISLSGTLSPDPHQFRCRVMPFQ